MMGSPTAELARKLMNKEANKLAKEFQNNDPKDVGALKEIARSVWGQLPFDNPLKQKLHAALSKLEPKPAKVYVLPEYGRMHSAMNDWLTYHTVGKSKWDDLRELTATDAPAQKWNMPEWDELEITAGQKWETLPYYSYYKSEYEAIRDKIMAMND